MKPDTESVLFAASFALQGILASPDPCLRGLPFERIVDLAANYGEALAERIENPPAKA